MSYHDYLDFWYENYCKINLKYTTQEAYKNIIDKYLKPSLGLYRLSAITSVTLHSFLNELCSKYSFSRSYFKNILKVIKGTFRDATDVYGFIRYNPSLTLKLPKIYNTKNIIKSTHLSEQFRKLSSGPISFTLLFNNIEYKMTSLIAVFTKDSSLILDDQGNEDYLPNKELIMVHLLNCMNYEGF
jgi:hypothetical protein